MGLLPGAIDETADGVGELLGQLGFDAPCVQAGEVFKHRVALVIHSRGDEILDVIVEDGDLRVEAVVEVLVEDEFVRSDLFGLERKIVDAVA